MEIVLAWTVFIGLAVLFLALGWAWLAPRLPRRARLGILVLVAVVALALLAVTARIPHDYRLGDAAQDGFAMEVLGAQLLAAVVGGVAGLAAVGRRRTLNALLIGAGAYLAGVGLALYLLLNGQATIQAPTLVLVGSAITVASAARLSGLPRWLSRLLGPGAGLAVALAVEALRGEARRGAAPGDVLPLIEIGGIVLLLAGAYFMRYHGRLVAGPLARAAVGVAGTALVLLLRGPGEWAPTPHAGSTTLYGLPLTLLAIAVSLIIVDQPLGARNVQSARVIGRKIVPGWAPAAALAVLVALAAVWHPVPEACTSAPYSDSSAMTPGTAQWASSTQAAAPRGAPDVAEFDRLCLNRTANLAQIPYIVSAGCKWAQIDPNYPLVEASGTLRQTDLSHGDSPWLHTSHDLGLEIATDRASSWLVLGGAPPGPETLLHAEVESGPFPPAYRPVAGERVTVAGRWVFDCGHDPKTEIHPAAVVASERDEWRADAAGGPQEAHVVRVWMNSTPGVVHVPLAPFDMQVAFPSPPAGQAGTPVVQVAEGSAGAVRWAVLPGSSPGSGSQASLHIEPPSSGGSAYFEILLGYRGVAASASPPRIYTVTLDSLQIHDNLRSEARDTTGLPDLYFPQIGFAGSGHWYLQAVVGREWRSLLADAPVESGRTYPLAVPPVRVEERGDGHLHFTFTGYAENDPSDGVELASGSVNGPTLLDRDAGLLAGLCCGQEQSLTPEYGAWTLTYHVTRANP